MTDHLCPLIESIGLKLPSRLHIEYDLIEYARERTKAIGHCLHGDGNRDGNPQIYISPDLNDPVKIAEVILHELLHAALPIRVNHGQPFGQYAKRLGIRMMSTDGVTRATAKLDNHFRFLIGLIGDYPPPPKMSDPTTMPESADYPRMLFHRTKPPIIVHGRASEAAFGKEWARSPWPQDEASPQEIDWAGAWLKGQGFPKTYWHRDTGERRTVRNPTEERIFEGSLLWLLV
jgi:hypothetical protein